MHKLKMERIIELAEAGYPSGSIADVVDESTNYIRGVCSKHNIKLQRKERYNSKPSIDYRQSRKIAAMRDPFTIAAKRQYES